MDQWTDVLGMYSASWLNTVYTLEAWISWSVLSSLIWLNLGKLRNFYELPVFIFGSRRFQTHQADMPRLNHVMRYRTDPALVRVFQFLRSLREFRVLFSYIHQYEFCKMWLFLCFVVGSMTCADPCRNQDGVRSSVSTVGCVCVLKTAGALKEAERIKRLQKKLQNWVKGSCGSCWTTDCGGGGHKKPKQSFTQASLWYGCVIQEKS